MTSQATKVSLAPDTRTRILDLAENLLLERGFNAFSYQHIARELSVKPGARPLSRASSSACASGATYLGSPICRQLNN
jgi:hypothetical protein